MATLAQQKNQRQEGIEHAARIFDLDFIRRKLPIETVARLLEIEVNHNHFAHCFREDRHANGDANPSLHFLTRKNRATCFGCGGRSMSTIDFVIAVLEYRNLPHTFSDAIRWFGKEFGNLPTLKGRPAGLVRDKPFHVGVAGPFEYFVRSDLYASLTKPAKIIYSVIRDLSDGERKTRIPYRTLRRHAGFGSDHTIKSALDELVAIHLLDIHKSHAGSLEPYNVYRLTPDDPEFLRLANESCQRNREAIATEVEFYREQRLAKRRKPKPITEAIHDENQ
jgi:hypothetical protein